MHEPNPTKQNENNENNKTKEEDKLVIDNSKRKYHFKVPKTKIELVKEILKRWWYGFDDWLKRTDDYYIPLLEKHKLREIEFEKFMSAPDVVQGLRKVYKVEGYHGLYLDSNVL